MSQVLWNASDENIVVKELLLVGTEELSIELKGSAHFVSDLEVSHSFNSLVELDWVSDLDNGGVEWSGNVLSDLRTGLENNLGSFFKGHGDLFGVGLLLWEIV